jgi:prephenate dehydrogenase
MSTAPMDKLVVVGVGLIGGSFALALKQRQLVRHVVGIGRGRENLETALRLGIIDEASLDYQSAGGADLVFVATPVAQMPAAFARLAPHLGESTIVTDGGSTKQDVIAAARSALGSGFSRFVPGHPIAGTEHSGAASAFATLFDGRKVVLTPEAETGVPGVARTAGLWSACGADVRQMPAARHDAIFAAVSHLPHLLAFGLVEALASRPEAEDFFTFAASGFRDFTRIAGSDPEMWRDVSLANRGALRAELARYRAQIDRIDALLASGDGEALRRLFTLASDARRAWQASIE